MSNWKLYLCYPHQFSLSIYNLACLLFLFKNCCSYMIEPLRYGGIVWLATVILKCVISCTTGISNPRSEVHAKIADRVSSWYLRGLFWTCAIVCANSQLHSIWSYDMYYKAPFEVRYLQLSWGMFTHLAVSQCCMVSCYILLHSWVNSPLGVLKVRSSSTVHATN